VTTHIASAIFTTANDPLENWEGLAIKAQFRAAGMAKIIGVSLRTVQRHFRTNYELSVQEWLNSVRLDRALELLRQGERTKEVAFQLGFKQVSHFSREFKRRFGISPSELACGPISAGPFGLFSSRVGDRAKSLGKFLNRHNVFLCDQWPGNTCTRRFLS
jgi:AraC-like DNA-binding protein